MEQVTQEFLSDLRQLADMRAVVRDVCQRAWGVGSEDEGIAQLELALDEAAANVILHAYEGRKGQYIELVASADPASISVTLYHQGRGFDPETVAPPCFDGSREGGFGLYIMRKAVDELAFFQDERGRHAVRLVKKRRGAAL
jgi:anti-sigma regulatory factor (Ser/Thr protein kinase)